MTTEQGTQLAQLAVWVGTAQELTAQARGLVYTPGMIGATNARTRLAIMAAADNLTIAANELQAQLHADDDTDAPLKLATVEGDE